MGSNAKPTVIVVHGAFHRPEQYSYVTDLLSEAGYKVAAPNLPSTALDEPVESFDPDVKTIRIFIEDAVDRGEEVIVACHSYAGVPASEATKGLLKKERKVQGLSGGVISMVYICAFVADVGQCIADIGDPLTGLHILESGKSIVVDPAPMFYNDIEPATAVETIARLRSQSTSVVLSQVSFAPWKHIPSTYILCEMDAAIRPDIQEKLTHPSRGGLWTIRRLASGHSPFLNMPDQVFDIIEEAIAIARAGSRTKIGERVEKSQD